MIYNFNDWYICFLKPCQTKRVRPLSYFGIELCRTNIEFHFQRDLFYKRNNLSNVNNWIALTKQNFGCFWQTTVYQYNTQFCKSEIGL